jgi:hypothetical protein
MPTTHEIQRMSADLPEEDTYIVTNVITVDAPLDFVWENLPKNIDFSQVMQPYGWFPGVRTLGDIRELQRNGLPYHVYHNGQLVES